KRTPINVVQHQYFNLGTTGDILDHRYQLLAPAYTELGEDLIPSGAILPVKDTNWDFNTPRTLRDPSGAPIDYDGNLVLASGRRVRDPVAVAAAPDGGLTRTVWADRPGLQFDTAVWTGVDQEGMRLGKHAGFCLEDQVVRVAVHRPHFPSGIYGRDR